MILTNARPERYLFALLIGATPLLSQAEVLFEENFDNQPDWTITMYNADNPILRSRGDVVPDNWDGAYNGSVWTTEEHAPQNHSSHEILASNADKARGGSGKSIVHYRHSWTLESGRVKWNSDSQLIKAPIDPDNPEGTEELYVEFWIRFSENWFYRGTPSGEYPGGWMSKIFRAASWTPGEDKNMVSGGARDLGPMFYWDYRADKFGVRNKTSFRGGPPANAAGTDNYKVPSVEDAFGESGNFNALDIAGEGIDGTDPQLKNQVDGTLLADTEDLVSHEMLFGPPQHWTKVAFYLKMNSAPGVPDGVFSQFINGHRIKHIDNIPWVETNEQNMMVKWNHFSIGGNDYFAPKANDERFEDWYAIDDIVVMSHLPESLQQVQYKPNPPSEIRVD